MTSAKEYREFAAECLLWATEVASEKDRQIFLDMARDWTLAAIRLEGLLIPNGDFQVGEPQPGSTGTGE
ncbi:MAG: hypothetical protein WAL80_12440 [Xanthobacteraceae bacterium]